MSTENADTSSETAKPTESNNDDTSIATNTPPMFKEIYYTFIIEEKLSSENILIANPIIRINKLIFIEQNEKISGFQINGNITNTKSVDNNIKYDNFVLENIIKLRSGQEFVADSNNENNPNVGKIYLDIQNLQPNEINYKNIKITESDVTSSGKPLTKLFEEKLIGEENLIGKENPTDESDNEDTNGGMINVSEVLNILGEINKSL